MRGKKLATLKTILASLFVMSMVFVMGTTTAEAAPAKVTDVKQTSATKSSIDLTWNPVAGSNIKYEVQYSLDKVNWESDSAYKNENCLVGLNAGSTYFVRVAAVSNYTEYGTYSDPVEMVTSPDVTTEAVVQTDATSSSATVCWNAVPGANVYDVYYYTTGDQKVVVASTSETTAIVPNIPADSYFTVYVDAKRVAVSAPNFAACSDYMYATGVMTTPDKLAIVKYDRDPRKKVYKKKNSYYNTMTIAHGLALNANGYEVYLYNSKGKLIKTVDDTNIYTIYTTIPKVKTTDTVYVQVRAYTYINGTKKYGEYSDKLLSVGAPTATAKKSGSGVKISWSKIAGAKKYNIYMSTDGKSYKKIKTVSSKKSRNIVVSKFKGKKFKAYQTYYYYVEAVGKYGKKTAKSDIFWVNSFSFRYKYK